MARHPDMAAKAIAWLPLRREVRLARPLPIDASETLVRDVAVLLIEHNMNVVMDPAHRITVLDSGRILAESTPTQIRAVRVVQAAYLGV
jgi:ABC-type hemin transport system ATPase subunit